MTETGYLISRGLTVIFLIIVFLVGVFSYKDSTRRIDKLRFGFLTVGSMLSLLFALNV
ncbi:MAG: hypothetical protein E6860_07260 [Clostridium sp.]|uniref:hypothetical protein n=1 Tax=Clostridium sp. TaxID=1506 RepID=UPI002903EAD0|nr:hypothetical protein [Clostridium sp.]MDU1585333.1 hypothetical protein [Clostridium sp.]MDU1978435.1 hypothetical protein [Clostridium sp.]MDU1994767.1 hypothetical protein [Clostridium sp.]MDU6048426.1 hypothetical protein [Clostridium sp.]MDU6222483.1 hypothetical protein [Clostridium sp.]